MNELFREEVNSVCVCLVCLCLCVVCVPVVCVCGIVYVVFWMGVGEDYKVEVCGQSGTDGDLFSKPWAKVR